MFLFTFSHNEQTFTIPLYERIFGVQDAAYI